MAIKTLNGKYSCFIQQFGFTSYSVIYCSSFRLENRNKLLN